MYLNLCRKSPALRAGLWIKNYLPRWGRQSSEVSGRSTRGWKRPVPGSRVNIGSLGEGDGLLLSPPHFLATNHKRKTKKRRPITQATVYGTLCSKICIWRTKSKRNCFRLLKASVSHMKNKVKHFWDSKKRPCGAVFCFCLVGRQVTILYFAPFGFWSLPDVIRF